MKLSDIKGDRVLDVVADIVDPIANIASDDAAKTLFHREKLPEGVTAKEFTVQRLRKGVPSLLKDHKDDIITILATLDGVSKEEYAESLNLAKLMHDFVELLTDEALMTLFT